jgi:transcriptional regulator with XRE-family HTH domain
MSSNLLGLGRRVQELRNARGQSQADFAAAVGATEKMLSIIEADGLLHERNALKVLERIAMLAGQPLEALLFQRTGLIELKASQLKLKAFQIINENHFTQSLAVLNDVFAQIDDQVEMAFIEQAAPSREYRNGGLILSELNEDTVHEMVLKARRRLQ